MSDDISIPPTPTQPSDLLGDRALAAPDATRLDADDGLVVAHGPQDLGRRVRLEVEPG